MRSRERFPNLALALSVITCCTCIGLLRAQTTAGSIVEYAYDAVGNIVAIQSSSAQLGVSSFSPASGPIGATVTIVGSGFATSAAANSVRINGTVTPVVSAERTRLTITVPFGATTGPITVTVGGSTASSMPPFIVASEYAAPTIASFTPSIAVAGTTVSVSGSNFNPAIASDSARVGIAAATITSATSAIMTVLTPTGTGSGHIQVSTPKGTATSSGFLFVPPGTYSATAVVSTVVGALDSSSTVSIGAPGKLGLIAFDVVAPRSFGIFGSASTLGNGTLQLLDPTRAVIASTSITTSGGTIPVRPLNQSGTYTIAVIAGASSTGSITLLPGAPDLVVSNPSLGTIVANQNGSHAIPVTYTVTNVGNAVAQSPWYDMAYLSVDATLDDADQHLNGWPSRATPLLPGASYTATGTFTTSPSTPTGNYTLFVKADGRGPLLATGTNTDDGRLIEVNEANNTQSLPITLARPDLVVTSASVASIAKNTNGSYRIAVTYTVQNAGSVTAQPYWYDLAYLSSDATLDNTDQHLTGLSRRDTPLAPGASYTATATYTTTTSTPGGSYTLFIKADGHGAVLGNGTNTDGGKLVEANDANNARALAITLTP